MDIFSYLKVPLSTENTSALEPPRDEALAADTNGIHFTQSNTYSIQHSRVEHRNAVDTFAIFTAPFHATVHFSFVRSSNSMITLSFWVIFLITPTI